MLRWGLLLVHELIHQPEVPLIGWSVYRQNHGDGNEVCDDIELRKPISRVCVATAPQGASYEAPGPSW